MNTADAMTDAAPAAPPQDPPTGAEAVLALLCRHGVDTVFGYPGAAIMPLYDAMIRGDGVPRHLLHRHEQGAGFAASGYARATGRLGVCIATSGPGATNLVTAVTDAHMDSVPMLVITGQVPTGLMGTDAFQETDVLGLSLGITKHGFLVRRVEDLVPVLREAIRLAREGRPGPVWVDIPKDVQQASLPGPLPPPEPPVTASPGLDSPGQEALERARALLRGARRPVLYAGGGVVAAGAVEALRAFVDVTEIPAVTTLRGLGLLPPGHPRDLGMLGMHGSPCANRAVQDSDLLVVVGARFDDRATGRLAGFAPGARIIHLDGDPAEVSKLRAAEVGLLGDLNQLLPALAIPLEIAPWREACATARASRGHGLPPVGADGAFPPLHFLRELSRRAGPGTRIACDVGQHQMWVAQHYAFHHPRQHLTSSGLGAMGFGLPAAIGAQMADPGGRVIAISGDGSILMNVQELATLRRYDLPVKVVVFDNAYLGMVRQQQALFCDGRLSEVDLSDNPDFTRVAEAFGIPARRFEGAGAVEDAVAACLETPGPLLLHIPVAREQGVWPLVGPGLSNDQMIEEDPA
ncbi:MAG: acetolactate synthase 2 catalytic subunit [Ectothiorhodospira sp.]